MKLNGKHLGKETCYIDNHGTALETAKISSSISFDYPGRIINRKTVYVGVGPNRLR